jgi:hypothetical protein
MQKAMFIASTGFCVSFEKCLTLSLLMPLPYYPDEDVAPSFWLA